MTAERGWPLSCTKLLCSEWALATRKRSRLPSNLLARVALPNGRHLEIADTGHKAGRCLVVAEAMYHTRHDFCGPENGFVPSIVGESIGTCVLRLEEICPRAYTVYP
jgi:hypothetical protein